MTRAVFLDRDGVINELVCHPELDITGAPFQASEYKLIPGVVETINSLHRSGYIVIVISNQPDVAKGRMTLDAFKIIREKMKAELAEAGAFIDGEYYCMHHPQAVLAQYKVICDCRKPKPGLLLRAAREHDIDMQRSLFVGDNFSDVEAGKGAGCRTILIGKMKHEICDLMDKRNTMPNIVSTNLTEAVQHLLKTGV
jgi:D-glycero-D-manno-heptose 1,7-bisphosphate phosphatase